MDAKSCNICKGKGLLMDGASSTTTCDSCGGTGISGGYKKQPSIEQSKLNDGVKCRCENVQMGSYGNQLWVHPPSHMPKDNGYCLDRCIAEEVMQLWMKDITTTGCCCGHGKVASFIGVIDSDIPKMKELGYKVASNKSRLGDEDSFYAKGT